MQNIPVGDYRPSALAIVIGGVLGGLGQLYALILVVESRTGLAQKAFGYVRGAVGTVAGFMPGRYAGGSKPARLADSMDSADVDVPPPGAPAIAMAVRGTPVSVVSDSSADSSTTPSVAAAPASAAPGGPVDSSSDAMV